MAVPSTGLHGHRGLNETSRTSFSSGLQLVASNVA
jgi:hypothetical protein